MSVTHLTRHEAPDVVRDLGAVRHRTLGLVAHLTDDQLERQVDPLWSPLVWDLAHIAAYEDLWLVHRHGQRPLLRPDLAATYDAFETPRATRGVVELLRVPEALGYLETVRERTLEVVAERGVDREIHEMVLRHELQHTETMLQAMVLGGQAPDHADGPLPVRLHGDLEFARFDGGAVAVGAPDEGFAHDNERPRHEVDLAPFAIARAPVTNATWLTFSEGGGYTRREWWSDEGWSWKEEYDITGPAGSTSAVPEAPADRLSWYEADAFARSRDARLPSEAEWEHAASSPAGLGGTGRVWEWMRSEFTGYPGFRAHPYPEYSEAFFAKGYRALRGGSWATHGRVASTRFRNWDLPQRWQIFAGVRLAADVG